MKPSQTPDFSFERDGKRITCWFSPPLKSQEGKIQYMRFSMDCESELEAALLLDYLKEFNWEMRKNTFLLKDLILISAKKKTGIYKLKTFMAQTKDILNDLLTGARITSLEAINRYGCTRLAARIKNVEEMGYKVERRMVEVPTRNGKTKVAEYWIEPKPKPRQSFDIWETLPLFI